MRWASPIAAGASEQSTEAKPPTGSSQCSRCLRAVRAQEATANHQDERESGLTVVAYGRAAAAEEVTVPVLGQDEEEEEEEGEKSSDHFLLLPAAHVTPRHFTSWVISVQIEQWISSIMHCSGTEILENTTMYKCWFLPARWFLPRSSLVSPIDSGKVGKSKILKLPPLSKRQHEQLSKSRRLDDFLQLQSTLWIV